MSEHAFRVIAHNQVVKFLKKLADQKTKFEIIQVLKSLRDFPTSVEGRDCKKLKNLKNFYRIRIGTIRIVFYVDLKNKEIIITRVDRKKVYKR